MNLLILVLALICSSVFSIKYLASFDEGGEDLYRYFYYFLVDNLAQLIIEFYVDLFFLWLLYRFVRPQKFLEDGRTEASALLFAHNGKEAQ